MFSRSMCWRFHELFDQALIACDRRHDQGRSDRFNHLCLRHFEDTGVREKVLANCQRVRKRVAAHNCRPQVNRAIEGDQPRAASILRRHLFGAGGLQALVDRRVDKLGHFGVRKSRKHGALVVDRARLHRSEPLRQTISDFVSMCGHDDRGGVQAAAAAILRDRVHHEVEVIGPALDLIRTDQNFAVAGTVNLNPRVAGIAIGGRFVAEKLRASAEPQDLLQPLRGRWGKSQTLPQARQPRETTGSAAKE